MSNFTFGNREDMIEGGIVPFERIEVMHYFYTSDSVKNDKVIEVVDVKDKKKATEEVQGAWALEQTESVLDALRVRSFVIQKDKGGHEIPTIEKREKYVEAHAKAKQKTLNHLVNSQENRETYIEVLRNRMEKAKTTRETVYGEILRRRSQIHEAQDKDQEDSEEEEQQILANEEEDLEDEVNDAFAKAYAKLNSEQQAQNDDMMKYESIIETCRKDASRQHDEDADAVNRLRSALFVLKKFIQGLIKKFNFLEDIIRQKRSDGMDPYDENDMRSCYINLLDRYRQSDEMGVLTTIMSGMAEKQGNKPMESFLLNVEDWHQTMIRLGVKTMDVSDLAAIILLKGMHENNRMEFLEQENALELTLETLDQDDLDIDDDKSSNTSILTTKKEKKTLLVRVKKFIQQDKNKRLINQRLSGGSGISSSNSQSGSKKEAEERFKEAQNVFVTALQNDGICRSYTTTGHCRFGKKCRYRHEDSILTKKSKQLNEGDGKSKSELECFSWRDTGSCRFGDNCNFRHGTPYKAQPQLKAQTQVSAVVQEPKGSGSNKKTANAKVTEDLFSVDEDTYSAGWKKNNDEKVTFIVAPSLESDSGETEKVLNIDSNLGTRSTKLGWDSMASIHVAQRREDLGDVIKLKHSRMANGLGGPRQITHQGYNPQFNLNMHVIEGGQTPNIKSMGVSLQPDGDGTEYVAIFTAKGATQMSLSTDSKQRLMAILNQAAAEERIIGTAQQRNGVYEERFSSGLEEDPTDEEKAYAVTSMYTHRAPMTSADEIIGMLASACVKEAHLIAGIKNHSIKGLPECVTEESVKKYFKVHGKDEDIIMAEIANAPLKTPLDYSPDVYTQPGEHLQMDNVDPSFSRVHGEKYPTRSIGGYRDAVVAVDNCGYSVVKGREKKKDPHLVVQHFIEHWVGRWKTLRKLSADNEFITVDTIHLCKQKNIIVRQAVPYDHRRGLGASEGLNRWLQDCAQAHMNRLTPYVKASLITEQEKRSLWFHALTYANDIKLLGPSKCDPDKTQFEEGEGVPFNFSKYVVLPFGLRVIVRKKQGDQDGRGLDGIYVGFSRVVTGGILVYMFTSKRIVQKYTFIPRSPMPVLSDLDLEYASVSLYGDITVNPQVEPTVPQEVAEFPSTVDFQKSTVGGDISNLTPYFTDTKGSTAQSSLDHAVGGDSTAEKVHGETEDLVMDEHSSEEVENSTAGYEYREAKQIETANHNTSKESRETNKSLKPPGRPPNQVVMGRRIHFTRSQRRQEKVLHVSSERPPKPKVPTKREASNSLRWQRALKREIVKINEENTLTGLPKNELKQYIRPDDAIIMRLIQVREYKWKVDPDTNIEGWLEVVRIVCDGSTDKRVGEVTYAETPDRTLLYLMASIEASMGIHSRQGDAIRAYLNAPSLDKNLVVIADRDMTEGTGSERFERESLLLKGLYGSIKGALSFQVWIEKILKDLDYSKCDIARGVYLKTVQDDMVRILRHSDDFRISATEEHHLDEQIGLLRSQVRTTPFKNVTEFLGCQFTRYKATTMTEDPNGDILLVTMSGQIEKLEKDFGHLRSQFNPAAKVRYTPLPLKPILDEDDMSTEQKVSLHGSDIKLYMSLVMSIGWIVGNIRPNLKFSHHVIAKKLACPRKWDMFLAVWLLEHIILTKEWPLILGGPVVDPEVYSDSSFAGMEEKRTVASHCVRCGPDSGVINAQVKTLKVSIKSIFEGEAYAASDGQDTSIYVRRAVEDMKYPSQDSRKVYVDNTPAIDWMLGSTPTKRSKHMEVRLYRSRHLVADGEVVMEYMPTADNIADILTKSLPRARYEMLSGMMLGHGLVQENLRFWLSK